MPPPKTKFKEISLKKFKLLKLIIPFSPTLPKSMELINQINLIAGRYHGCITLISRRVVKLMNANDNPRRCVTVDRSARPRRSAPARESLEFTTREMSRAAAEGTGAGGERAMDSRLPKITNSLWPNTYTHNHISLAAMFYEMTIIN